MKERYLKLINFSDIEPDETFLSFLSFNYLEFYLRYLVTRRICSLNHNSSIFLAQDPLQIVISYNTSPFPRTGARIVKDIGSPITIPDFGVLTGARKWLEQLEEEKIKHPFYKVVNGIHTLQSSVLYLPHNLAYIQSYLQKGGEVLVLGRVLNHDRSNTNTDLTV